MPAADTLYGELDSPGDAGPVYANRSGGRDLQPEPERAPRDCHGPAVSQTYYLDVRHQGRPYHLVRYLLLVHCHVLQLFFHSGGVKN